MINNILKKIEKANEVQNVELEKHEVELGAIDDLLVLVNKSRSVEGEMVENYFEIITRPKRKLLTEILDKLPKVNIPENKKLSELYYEEKMKEYKNEQ